MDCSKHASVLKDELYLWLYLAVHSERLWTTTIPPTYNKFNVRTTSCQHLLWQTPPANSLHIKNITRPHERRYGYRSLGSRSLICRQSRSCSTPRQTTCIAPNRSPIDANRLLLSNELAVIQDSKWSWYRKGDETCLWKGFVRCWPLQTSFARSARCLAFYE